MSNQQNWNEIGKRLRDAVQDAFVTGDFKEMNQVVSELVRKAGKPDVRQPSHKTNVPPRIRIKKVGSVAGVLLIVFGGIGTGLSAIALLGTLFLFWGKGTVLPFMCAAVLLAGFIIMTDRGCMRRNRIRRAERYVSCCEGKSYINIEELALHMGKSKRYILKDVKKMIRLGIFPEGHLDEQESCLILNDATFKEYLRLQKERKVLEMEEKVARMQERQKAGGASMTSEKQAEKEDKAADTEAIDDPELAALIGEGNDCIRKLREMNEEIEGEVISAKLSMLENLLQEIFDRVKEHPEQMPQMQKFMNYYLPTTLKLVEAYEEFDDVSVPGEDIISAKREIEQTLDTINQAFAELLNKLFQASVYDVTTDAQVLQTMLAREGLTGNGQFDR